MSSLTKQDVVIEAAEKTKGIRENERRSAKKTFENIAAIISILAIFLSIVLYAYNYGYCKVFNLPVHCVPIDLKRYLPFAINIVSMLLYILYYATHYKTDKVLEKNRINIMRIFYGFAIVLYFINYNLINNVIGTIWTFIISLTLPLIIELMLYRLKQPRKNKPVNENEHKTLLEDSVYDMLLYNSYIKPGTFILILTVTLASPFGQLKAKAADQYQTFSCNNTLYAVVVDYDEKVLAQEAIETEKTLTIKTDYYLYIPKDTVTFSYNKYDDVIISASTEKEGSNENTSDEKENLTEDITKESSIEESTSIKDSVTKTVSNE